MKKKCLVLCVLVLVLSIVGVFGAGRAVPDEEELVRAGLVLSFSGRGDQGFNDLAYEGLDRARDKYGVRFEYVEPGGDMSAVEHAHTTYARAGYDLIIGISFTQQDIMKRVAEQFPDSKFAIVDGLIDLPNVASLRFKEHEGSFIVGALAAIKTEQNSIGFVGGIDSPLIRKFELGYRQGAEYVNPDINVFVSYAGSFNDPSAGKELAIAQFERGADIVFHAAGSTGTGVIEAASEKNKLAIGVDANQNWMAPGYVLTSMLKRVDEAVFSTVEKVINDEFAGGVFNFGLEEDGVGYSLDEHNEALISNETRAYLDDLKEKIIRGEIVVRSE